MELSRNTEDIQDSDLTEHMYPISSTHKVTK